MQVGCLPFIPSPVTDYVTVYTAMKNVMNVSIQLRQQILPLFCDEGVFRIVVDIYLKHYEEFQNLLPMLGAFHMTKVAQHSAGKYISGTSSIYFAISRIHAFLFIRMVFFRFNMDILNFWANIILIYS